MLTTFEFVSSWIKAHTKSDRGASLVEYALLLALIAVVCIFALQALGEDASQKFNEIGEEIDNAGG